MSATKLFFSASFAVFALLSAARADLACPGLIPHPFSSIQTQIDLGGGQIITGTNIDCSKISVGAKTVLGIQNMLYPALRAPDGIKFRMVDVFDNAFFNPTDLSLNVPYQMVLNTYAKNPIASIPIWAHEFGHAVLDKELVAAAPKWRAYIQRGLAPNAAAGTSDTVVDDLVSGYHEFFADVIAVLYIGQGDAVAKALYFTGFIVNPEGKPGTCPNQELGCAPRKNLSNNERMLLTIPRDFTDRHNQIGTWRGSDPYEPHNLLAPARYHIWKYFLSNPLIMHQKGAIAAATIDAIMADINRRMQRMAARPGGITPDAVRQEMSDPVRINTEFLGTINATFKQEFKELN
jgi:hypothetical protein